MRKAKISWTDRVRKLFSHKLKPYLVDEKYKVIPAFDLGGTTYWMYDSTNEVPAGRFFAAMGIYQEMDMNCSKEYLESHVKAMENILNPKPGKPINLTWIHQINLNLKERLDLMPFQDYVYKLASVIFFDKSESLYGYDWDYNKLKIERWKAAGGSLDFFSNTPLKELVPLLTMPEKDTQTYLMATKMINETHQALLTRVQSESL